jgi:hypothetical protein
MKSFRQPPPTPPYQGGKFPHPFEGGLGGGYEVVEVILCTFLNFVF